MFAVSPAPAPAPAVAAAAVVVVVVVGRPCGEGVSLSVEGYKRRPSIRESLQGTKQRTTSCRVLYVSMVRE
ncbi:hypothetical protein B0O80DRAFT_461392 [Mortierella sp. GBAus27b]|nr:hypothetical protein B0O80DRAFT_461392 [Mortierella sp. GBAus27b]